MVQIGGKTKQKRAALPYQPQIVVQRREGVNEYAKFGIDDEGKATIEWIGDPRAATRFDSRFQAKVRVRDMEDVPDCRTFHALEQKR